MDTEKSNNFPDVFTPEFKRLKSRHPPPDLDEVLDLSKFQPNSDCSESGERSVSLYNVIGTDLKPVAGLKPWEEWRAYKFPAYPGLIVIQNPFVDGYQRYWVCRCLQDFPSQTDNVTNLSALGVAGSAHLWSDYVHRQSPGLSKQDPLRKLRWTTLGYHYNWTAKEYSEDAKAEFPSDVSCLSQYLAACLDFGPYRAEAAIVSYYHLDSTLAGHTDHSELDQSAPLFSVSFGQTAIFLLGGDTKAVKPMSIYLHSGDICVMSGTCRLAYHAVPRILAPPSSLPMPACFRLEQKQLAGDYSDISFMGTQKLTQCANGSFEPNVGAINGQSVSPGVISPVMQDSGREISVRQTVSGQEMSSNALQFDSRTSVTEKDYSTEKITTNETFYEQNAIGVGEMNKNDNQKFMTRHITLTETKRNCGADIEAQKSYVYNGQRLPISISEEDNSKYRTDYFVNVEKVNCQIRKVVASLEFAPFERYLASARINMNVRQVLPWGMHRLPDKQASGGDTVMSSESCHCRDPSIANKEEIVDRHKNLKDEEAVDTSAQDSSSLLRENLSLGSQVEGIKKKKVDYL